MRYALLLCLTSLAACSNPMEPTYSFPNGCRLHEVVAATPGHPGFTLDGIQLDPAICERVAREHPEITVTALMH
jgi:hypothetical protein